MRSLLLVSLSAVVLGVGLVSASSACADDVEPAPPSCPPGTRGRASHSGPHCSLLPACTPSECPPGFSCVDHGFCLLAVECGGRRPDDDECFVDHVVGDCDAGGGCAGGARCVHQLVCLPAAAAPPSPAATGPAPPAATTPSPSTTTPAPEASSGCAVFGRAPSLLSLVAMSLAALWLRSRR